MRRAFLIIGILLLVGLVAVATVNRKKGVNGNSNSANRSLTNTTGTNIASDGTNTNVALGTSRTEVLTVSRMFSERFTSTSSDNPTGHLAAVEPFTSKALKASFKRLAAAWPATPGQPESTTSRAFAFSVRTFDEQSGRADVTVTLRRTERVGTEQPVTYRQDLILQLIREDGSWKVNVAALVPRS